MTRVVLDVFVPGTPIAKGALKAFAHRTTGRIVTTSAVKGLPAWEAAIRRAAFDALGETFALLTGPVRVDAVFWFQRPKSHYRSDGVTLRADAPAWHTQAPDRDKLERAVGDALNAVLYRDDKQVADGRASKHWAERSGVRIRATTLDETP